MDIPSYEPLVLIRILCGVWLVPHLIGKILHIERASVTFDNVKLRPGRLFVIVTILLELLAGIGLVFGIYEKLAAALLVVIMLGAGYAVVKINGFNWRWQKQGPEYIVFWAIVCVLSVSG